MAKPARKTSVTAQNLLAKAPKGSANAASEPRSVAVEAAPAQTAAPKPRFGKGQPAHYCGKPGRSGAPKGSANAIRHGMKGSKLPKGCQYIENRVNSLRRQVEEALITVKGEINFVDAAAVNSILKWERHGLLAAHWLRHQIDKLSPSDRLKFSEAIAKASDNRDKAIRSLGLDRDKANDVLDALYSRALPAPSSNGDDAEDTDNG
jgi:hypothetical protein